MIAMVDTRPVCPNCGVRHFYQEAIFLPTAHERDVDLRRVALEHRTQAYEAERERRRLALSKLPQIFPPPQVNMPDLRHLVHQMRSQGRRPAMTLLQRVRQAMGRRRQVRTCRPTIQLSTGRRRAS